jgi:hypothetical protein
MITINQYDLPANLANHSPVISANLMLPRLIPNNKYAIEGTENTIINSII